ncbi:hypothetical protein BS78_03G239900 [Paspalum vaginatum]|nr:hypothetical protein BS78_03G239900 [Paspalum vaginatum]
METQGTCPDCGDADESVYHALISCTFASMFWQCFNELYNIKLPKLHPATWCYDLLDNLICPVANCGPILCGMRAVWTAHDERRHGERNVNLLQACRWAKEISYDLIASGEYISGKDCPQVMKWNSPPASVVKVNVDAAFHEERQQGAIGVIIQNEKG